MASTGHEAWRDRAGWLLATALLAVLIFGYLLPVTAYFTAVPGDILDARYNSLVLEHLYRVVTSNAQLWDPGFFYPFKGVLAFSDNHLGSASTYVAARVLGLSREHAFDAWFVVGTLLNFASALYVLRRLGLSIAGAALGAFFFAFALPVPAQDIHAQLVHRFPAPLAALALWQSFERRRLADLARVAFFTVWQFYCSIYLGLFLAYLLAALTIALLIVRRPFSWSQWRANLAAERPSAKMTAGGVLLLSGLAFAYLAGSYLVVSHTYNLQRPAWTVIELLPRPGSYLMADGSWLLSWLGRDVSVQNRGEHQMFIGFGALTLVVAAAVSRHTAIPALTRSMLISLGLLVVGSLWIEGFSFYYLIAWLPGIQAIRAVSRVILIMLVPMSVLVALGADAALRRIGTRAGAVLALAALAMLIAIEPLSVKLVNTPITKWRERVDRVESLLPAVMPADPILIVRTPSADLIEQEAVELDAMMLGQNLGYPLLNGYSGFFPWGYRLHPCVSAKERLWGYFLFTGGRVKISEFTGRVVVLDLATCSSPAL